MAMRIQSCSVQSDAALVQRYAAEDACLSNKKKAEPFAWSHQAVDSFSPKLRDRGQPEQCACGPDGFWKQRIHKEEGRLGILAAPVPVGRGGEKRLYDWSHRACHTPPTNLDKCAAATIMESSANGQVVTLKNKLPGYAGHLPGFQDPSSFLGRSMQRPKSESHLARARLPAGKATIQPSPHQSNMMLTFGETSPRSTVTQSSYASNKMSKVSSRAKSSSMTRGKSVAGDQRSAVSASVVSSTTRKQVAELELMFELERVRRLETEHRLEREKQRGLEQSYRREYENAKGYGVDAAQRNAEKYLESIAPHGRASWNSPIASSVTRKPARSASAKVLLT